MMQNIARKTVTFRHSLVRLIAPRTYELIALQYNGKRPMIEFLSTYFFGSVNGAEIGVAYGLNARYMMKRLSLKHLFLVDPYVPYLDTGVFTTEFANAGPEAIHDLTALPNVTFIQKPSCEAVKEVPDYALDFCYIDANHSYEAVKEDVNVWFPKVRRHGVLGGHDFSAGFQGVARATIEFSDALGLTLFTKGCDWWIIKP